MWNSVARSRSAITRAKASSKRKFSTRDYTIKETLLHLDPYAEGLSRIGVAFVAFGGALVGAICYVEGLKLELALNKIEEEYTAKHLEIAEKQLEIAEKQLEIMKEHTAKQIERAERRTMEKCIKFGCEKEFARYQKKAGVY